MRAVQFNSLSADERRRFVGATDNASPLFVRAFLTKLRTGPNLQVSALSIAGMLASGVGLLLALANDFASPRSSGQADLSFLALYGVFFVTLAYSLFSYARNRARAPLPYTTGTYVFTGDVVVAKPDGTLTIYPLTDAKVELHQVNPRAGERFSHLVLTYDDTKLLFVEEDKGVATRQFESIKALQSNPPDSDLFDADEGNGSDSLEPGDSGALGLSYRALVVSVGAALLAVPTWYVRNYLSDEALFANIQNTSDLQMMHRYALESKSAHAPAVHEQWMEHQYQRASDTGALVALLESYPDFVEGRWGARIRDRRFEIAQEQGRQALVAFTAAYPEHVEAMSTLLVLEVAHTRGINTVAAYRAFIASYPGAQESAEFRDLVAQRYAAAAAAAASAPEETRETLGALIASLQAHERAELHVRFSPPRHVESARIDRRHRNDARSHRYVRIAPHMTSARARLREEWMVDELNRRLGMHYPTDVLVASYGGHEQTPAVGPSLDIHYQLVPYGLPAEVGFRVFERFHMDFEVTLQVPGRQPYVLEYRTNPLHKSNITPDPDYPPPGFYDDEARRALQQLSRQIVEDIFGQDYSVASPLLRPEPAQRSRRSLQR